jgi:hypothetical protein
MSFLGFGRKKVNPESERTDPTLSAATRPAITEGIAYGLNIKPEHGYYVEVEPLDGDIKQVKLVDESDDGGYPPRGNPIMAGRLVKTEHLPTQMKWLDRQGHSIPDFDNGHINNVSERAKELIESFEPRVHQFVPVEYLDKAGNHLETRFLFFVGNRLDTFYDDNPTMVLAHGRMWVPAADLTRRGEELPPGKDPTISATLIIDSRKVGAAHIWVEKHSAGGLTFISEKMRDAIASAGLTGLKPGPVETV